MKTIDLFLEKSHKKWHSLTKQHHIDKAKFEVGIKWLYCSLLNKKMPTITYCNSYLDAIQRIFLAQNSQSDSIGKPMWKGVRDVIAPLLLKLRDDVPKQNIINTQHPLLMDEQQRGYIAELIWKPICDAASVINHDIHKNYSVYLGWDQYDSLIELETYEKLGLIKDENFSQYKRLIESNVFAVYEYEHTVFAILPPVKILQNKKWELHSTIESAVDFADETGLHFIDGGFLIDWVFQKMKENGELDKNNV